MTQRMVLRLQDSEKLQGECKYRVVADTNPEDTKKQSVWASVHVVCANDC